MLLFKEIFKSGKRGVTITCVQASDCAR